MTELGDAPVLCPVMIWPFWAATWTRCNSIINPGTDLCFVYLHTPDQRRAAEQRAGRVETGDPHA